MSSNKPDLIVIHGGGSPDAFAAIAVANVAYAAGAANREIKLVRSRTGSRRGNNYVNNYVQNPSLLPFPEAQQHFRYVFGYNNQRSTQVILQEAAKSNLVFFFGYCMTDEEMEQLLEVNPNVYVFDYHRNQLSRRVANRLSMYQHDPDKCAAQFAWDFFVPHHVGEYPALVSEVAFSIFNNKARGRELFFGFTACPFQSTQWVRLLGPDMQNDIHTILQRGQFCIDFHKVLQSQMLDSATIVRFEDGRANQKQVLTKAEKASDDIVIYMIQCPVPSAQYLVRCIKELPIAKHSIIIAYNHHIRERVYQYIVAGTAPIDPMVIVGFNANDPQCAARNGAYLQTHGWFTSNMKPQTLLNSLVNRIPTLIGEPT